MIIKKINKTYKYQKKQYSKNYIIKVLLIDPFKIYIKGFQNVK